MTNNITIVNDLYTAEEISEMTLAEVQDIFYDIFGQYEGIRKDAFTTYMNAFNESKS